MDTVSLEVQTALARRMPIIPVLVDDAVMPRPGELPQRLQEFSFINALKIDSGVDFNIHIGRLIEALDQILGRYTISSRADVGGHQRKIGSLPSTRVHGMVASQRSKFSRIAIIYISASVGMIWLAHYLIVIKLNLNFGYMRLATVIVSAACGFLLSWRYRCSWPSAVLISAVVAVTAVTGMVFTVAFIDRAPFVPSSIFEWQEIMEVLVLIILSTGAGNLVAAWCLLVKLRKHRRTGT
jgi:hypothetical protein